VNLSAPGPKPGFGCAARGDCDAGLQLAMFATCRDPNVFTDIAAHVGFGRKPRLRGADVERRGPARVWQLFSGVELQPALGRLLNSNETHSSASRALWCSATTIGRRDRARSNDPQQTSHRQRPTPTIVGVAPKGFDGTTIGMRPAVFVPITMRSVLDARRLVAPDGLLAYCSRACAGEIEAARASSHAVSRHHQ